MSRHDTSLPGPDGVLITSDTHLRDAQHLPTGLVEAAQRAMHIIHAGDISSLEVLRVLEACAPVTAVAGNVEDVEVQAALPGVARVDVGGVRFGVMHDAGPASGRHERLRTRFDDCDVCVYGHSHDPEVVRTEDGAWIVNPGSPTQRRRAPAHTFAWCEVARGRAKVHLVSLALAVALLVSGCGGDGPTQQSRTKSARSPADKARAVTLNAEQKRLITAYAPASTGFNTVVAALRLTDAGGVPGVPVDRAAAAYAKDVASVTRELRGMRMTLPETNSTRERLLAALTHRTAALDSLRVWIEAGAEAPGVVQARARHRARWDLSVGSARAATNLLSASRARARLRPTREDVFR